MSPSDEPTGSASRAHDLPNREARRPGFPGARFQTFDGVSWRCEHCGGLLRAIPGGRGCMICGRDYYAEDAVRAVLRGDR